MDDDNFAKWPIALIVVDTNLHFKGGKRREGLIPVFVHRRVCGSHHLLLPPSCPVGTKCNNIPKTLTILELLRHRLKTQKEETQSPWSVFHWYKNTKAAQQHLNSLTESASFAQFPIWTASSVKARISLNEKRSFSSAVIPFNQLSISFPFTATVCQY